MSFFQDIKNNFQRQGVLTQIIIVNVAVFLTVNVVGSISHLTSGENNLIKYLAMPVNGQEFLLKFWTIFTYMFTHEGLGHLFWNMVTFYFMAQIFFTIMGQRTLLYLYVMSGIAGGALLLILGMLFPTGAFYGGHAILLGASASVLGVGAVMAIYSPNYTVFLFGVFQLPYKYFYLIMFVVTTLIDLSENTGGKISHMGGALFGVIYGFQLKRGNDLLNFSFGFKRKSKLKIVSNNKTYTTTSVKRKSTEEHTMDELLDKISKSGYDSLTKSEKDELFRLSQKK